MYLSYFGIRVRDPKRSEAFYRDVIGLTVIDTMNWSTWTPSEPACVLLRDPGSGQRLELNYYPPGSPYGGEYRSGEELDHIGIRVDDLTGFLARLERLGIRPEKMAHYEGAVQVGPRLKMAYLRDPDGIQLELFQALEGEPVAYDPRSY